MLIETKMKNCIAIIPARIGSKRIKEKNIKYFFKKPIIAYSILLAKKSKLFKKIIVSTDSKKIANISKKYGASIEFLRPKKLSTDNSQIPEVVLHAIKKIKKKYSFSYVCCIFPVAPMIEPKDLRKSFKILQKSNFNYIFPVYKSKKKNNCLFLNSNGSIKKVIKNSKNNKSILYNDAGQFYWGKKETWESKKKIFGKKSFVMKLEKDKAIDVNTTEDWGDLIKIYKKNCL